MLTAKLSLKLSLPTLKIQPALAVSASPGVDEKERFFV